MERARAALTVRELAVKAGVGASTITKIENGRIDPNLVTVGKIAKALDIPLETLIVTDRCNFR